MIKKIYNFIYSFFLTNSNFFFIIGLLFIIIIKINNLLKLNFNFFALLGIICALTVIIIIFSNFFSNFFKNNIFLNTIFYHFLTIKDNLYKILNLILSFNFSFPEKLLYSFFILNFFILFFHLFLTISIFSFLKILIYIFLLISSLLNYMESYLIKKYFKKNERITYVSLQQKMHVNKEFILKKNKEFHYIQYRHFTIPFDPKIKEAATGIVKAIGGLAAVAGTLEVGLQAYQGAKNREQIEKHQQENLAQVKKQHQESLAQVEKQHQENLEFQKVESIKRHYDNCKQKYNQNQQEIASLEDSANYFNNYNKNVIQSKKEVQADALECMSSLKKTGEDKNIQMFSILESFFF